MPAYPNSPRNSPGKRSHQRHAPQPRRSDLKFDQKPAKPPSETKSTQRMNFRKHYKKAVEAVKKCNRQQSIEQLLEYLCIAEKHLAHCADERPSNRYLRLQLKIIQEEKKDLLLTRRKPEHPIPLVLDPGWQG